MSANLDEDEDEYRLQDDTLNILHQFLADRERADSEMPSEDWQLSQFWYSEETINRLVDEAVAALDKNGGRIACISCPSLIPQLLSKKPILDGRISIKLFEYDARFMSKFRDVFVQYDYRNPLDVPAELQNSFDLIIVDPPFISEECLVRTAQTVRLLSKPNDESKILLCTGSVIHELAYRLLKVRLTDFKPTHAKNLANEFSAYTNYTPLTL